MRFKKFYLTEGGLGGHMNHPYDILSAEELFDFYQKLFSGDLDVVEKLDGVNIFWAINKKGKVVFARNQSEEPSEDIESKFPLSHPAGDAFRAGFKAIEAGVKNLTKEDRIKFQLINEDGTTKHFINTEIIYGSIPNLIQYSDVDNFVKFHQYHLTPEKEYADAKVKKEESLLKEMAAKMGDVEIESDVVSYFGTPGKVERKTSVKKSHWIFKGPIHISKDAIRADLEDVAEKFKDYPEAEKLKDADELSKQELQDVMKALTTKIGSSILTKMASQLFSGKRKTSDNHPKIEGIIAKYKNKLIKITGDFSELNKKLWSPLKEGLGEALKELTVYILQDVLGTRFKTLNKRVYTSGKDMVEDPDEKFNKSDINHYIDKTFKKMEDTYNKELKDYDNVKRDEILKALRIAGYKLKNFKDRVGRIETKEELMDTFAGEFFGL